MSSMYPFGGAAARSCMRCGNPLGAKESQCARCGTYNPLPQGQQFGMSPQGASAPGWGQQAQQSPQAGNNAAWPGAMGPSNPGWSSPNQSGAWSQQQNNLFGGPNQQSPQQNMFGSQNNGFGGPNQSSLNNSFAAFPQNGVPSSPNTFFNATQQQNGFGNGMQQNGFGTDNWQSANSPAKPAWMKDQDDEKPEKKRNKGVVTLIIILVVVLIAGGGFGAYKLLKPHNTPTASINTNTSTTFPTPTGTPLFHEAFTNNNAGWDSAAPTGAKFTLANNGKLVLESDNKELYDVMLPGGKSYDNFRLDVDAGLTHGDQANGYGIIFRGASTQNSDIGLFYRFEIYGDGSFVVWKGIQKADGKLESDPLTNANAAPSKAINPTGMNHITIIAKGSSLDFLVNGTGIASFADTSYKSGVIALFVSNTTSSKTTAQATFENLGVWQEAAQ